MTAERHRTVFLVSESVWTSRSGSKMQLTGSDPAIFRWQPGVIPLPPSAFSRMRWVLPLANSRRSLVRSATSGQDKQNDVHGSAASRFGRWSLLRNPGRRQTFPGCIGCSAARTSTSVGAQLSWTLLFLSTSSGTSDQPQRRSVAPNVPWWDHLSHDRAGKQPVRRHTAGKTGRTGRPVPRPWSPRSPVTTADMLDQIQRASERDMTTRIFERESLKAFDEGSFSHARHRHLGGRQSESVGRQVAAARRVLRVWSL